MKKIIIIAGDKSADIYGAMICQNIKTLYQDKVKIYSCGGESLAQHSEQILNLVHHSVSGLWETIVKIKEFIKLLNYTFKKINEINPDLIILMDFPDFNLRLARMLNKKYKIFYYISPQVWAWRKKRINLIKKYIDTMIVIFPFEKEFYEKENIKVLYFGHPLLEIIPQDRMETENIITFMPGSRKNEIIRHLPVLIRTKKILQKRLKDYKFQIIKPDNIEKSFYEKYINKENILLVPHSYNTIKKSKFIVTSSGTATIELTILEIPFLVIYKLNYISYAILKRIVHTDFVGMVNILAGEKIVEEYIQYNVAPQNISSYILNILADPNKYKKIKTKLSMLKNKLLPLNATKSFAKYIGETLSL